MKLFTLIFTILSTGSLFAQNLPNPFVPNYEFNYLGDVAEIVEYRMKNVSKIRKAFKPYKAGQERVRYEYTYDRQGRIEHVESNAPCNNDNRIEISNCETTYEIFYSGSNYYDSIYIYQGDIASGLKNRFYSSVKNDSTINVWSTQGENKTKLDYIFEGENCIKVKTTEGTLSESSFRWSKGKMEYRDHHIQGKLNIWTTYSWDGHLIKEKVKTEPMSDKIFHYKYKVIKDLNRDDVVKTRVEDAEVFIEIYLVLDDRGNVIRKIEPDRASRKHRWWVTDYEIMYR